MPSEEPAKEEPKKLKPCCACPETRKVRDAWCVQINIFLRIVSYKRPHPRNFFRRGIFRFNILLLLSYFLLYCKYLNRGSIGR